MSIKEYTKLHPQTKPFKWNKCTLTIALKHNKNLGSLWKKEEIISYKNLWRWLYIDSLHKSGIKVNVILDMLHITKPRFYGILCQLRQRIAWRKHKIELSEK